jgi:hypothetical protein
MMDVKYLFEGIATLFGGGGGWVLLNIFHSESYPGNVAFWEAHNFIIYFNSSITASNTV